MSDLHNEILEELMTIDDAGNGQDEAIETIINIVREYDYENHEVLQVWKKDIRADERERRVQGYAEIREIYAGMDGFIPETAPEAYQQRIIKQMYDIAIKAIKAECNCDMRTKLVGDGCAICNPDYAEDIGG